MADLALLVTSAITIAWGLVGGDLPSQQLLGGGIGIHLDGLTGGCVVDEKVVQWLGGVGTGGGLKGDRCCCVVELVQE